MIGFHTIDVNAEKLSQLSFKPITSILFWQRNFALTIVILRNAGF